MKIAVIAIFNPKLQGGCQSKQHGACRVCPRSALQVSHLLCGRQSAGSPGAQPTTPEAAAEQPTQHHCADVGAWGKNSYSEVKITRTRKHRFVLVLFLPLQRVALLRVSALWSQMSNDSRLVRRVVLQLTSALRRPRASVGCPSGVSCYRRSAPSRA